MTLTPSHSVVCVFLSAKEAFEMRISPIIIDNTNIQAWEMKPYVTLVSITLGSMWKGVIDQHGNNRLSLKRDCLSQTSCYCTGKAGVKEKKVLCGIGLLSVISVCVWGLTWPGFWVTKPSALHWRAKINIVEEMEMSQRSERPTLRFITISTRRKGKVIVVGDSPLRENEDSICWSVLLLGKSATFLGLRVRTSLGNLLACYALQTTTC